MVRPQKTKTAKSAEAGSGGTIENKNDESGRLEVANQGEPREHTLKYDGNGNLESVKYASMPWKDRAYQYDPLNRLTQAGGPFGLINYMYDNVGNRSTRFSITAGQQVNYTYEYEPGTNRIDRITGPQNDYFSHDENGNITSTHGMTLVYNQNNRLVRIQEEGSLIADYVYNGSGQRIVKTVDGVDTVFLYDFDGNIVAEYLGDGTLLSEYLYRGGNRLAKADGETGEIYFYQNDRLGTPFAMTDSNNESVWEAMYLPFGEAIVNPGSTVENNFRFPGQYFDTESGLHYNYHRYYDPFTGRYLRADPIGLAGGINLYVYSQNNPINLIDPLGLITLPEIYAKVETFAKPYTIGGALVTTGGVTAVAGSGLMVVGYASIPKTGPAGALVGSVGVVVTATGVSMFTLGLDVYSDELRNRLGLPKWFDVITGFELLPKNGGNCEQ